MYSKPQKSGYLTEQILLRLNNGVDNEGQKQIWGFQNKVQRRDRERNRMENIMPIFEVRNLLFLLFTKYC
jgi:hypothetical protein